MKSSLLLYDKCYGGTINKLGQNTYVFVGSAGTFILNPEDASLKPSLFNVPHRNFHASCLFHNVLGTDCLFISGGINLDDKIIFSNCFCISKSISRLPINPGHLIVQEVPVSVDRFGHTSSFFDGYIYFFGGLQLNVNPTSFELCTTMLRFSLMEQKISTFQSNGSSPMPRCFHSSTTFAEKFFIFGGWNPKTSSVLNDLHVFNMNLGIWKIIDISKLVDGRPPFPRFGHIAAIIDEQFCVFGGLTSSTNNNNILSLKSSTSRIFSILSLSPRNSTQFGYQNAMDGEVLEMDMENLTYLTTTLLKEKIMIISDLPNEFQLNPFAKPYLIQDFKFLHFPFVS